MCVYFCKFLLPLAIFVYFCLLLDIFGYFLVFLGILGYFSLKINKTANIYAFDALNGMAL